MNLTPDEWQAVWLTLSVASPRRRRRTAPGGADGMGGAGPLPLPRPAVAQRAGAPSTLVLPPVVTGWLLLLIFGIRGPIGALLLDWFGIRLVFTTAGASLACAVMTFPVMIRAVRLSLEAADPGLEQAARTLGAGRLGPVVQRDPAVGITRHSGGRHRCACATCLGEFGAVITFAANIPGQTQTLPLAIYSACCRCRAARRRPLNSSLVSLTLALIGLLLSEWLAKRLNAALGR